MAVPVWKVLSKCVEFTSKVTGKSSRQGISSDTTLDAAVGSTGDNPKYFGAGMFNVFGDTLTKAGAYLGGVIGAYSITGTKASTYPAGAVLAQITDGVTAADGAVVAYIDGDSAVTTAGAAFKVRTNNSNAASGFDFGVDLQDAAHDGFAAVDEDFYLKAPVRLVGDVCMLVKNGAPVDGTTGATVAGPGSILVDRAGAKAYINTGTKNSPTWTVLGSQS